MIDGHMAFLDTRRIVGWYDQSAIHHILELASSLAEQSYGDDALLFRHLHGFDDILGIAAGGYSEQYVS